MTHAIAAGRQQLIDVPIDTIDKTSKANTAAIRDTAADVGSTGSKLDETTLSQAGNVLAKAAATADSDDVRADKVSALKSAIDSGTYNVPASAVADKLISNLLG